MVHRRDSAVLDLDDARSIVQRVPGAQLALVAGESLLPYGEPMEPVANATLEFFSGGTSADTLAGPVEDAQNGQRPPGELGLTARQIEVLRLLASGRSNREIGQDLGISVYTVDRHISTIYRRIGARGRADATAFAMRNSLL